MLARWGTVVSVHRRLVLLLSAVALVASIAAIAAFGASLSSSGFIDTDSESARVERQLADAFGRGRSSLVFLFDAGRPVADAAVRAEIEAALAPLAADERVSRMATTWNTNNPRMVSTDGTSTYAVALLHLEADAAQSALDDLRGWSRRARRPTSQSRSLDNRRSARRPRTVPSGGSPAPSRSRCR